MLARKEFPASYHLAVTVDDAIQGVTLVTRGEDLAPATHIHRVLQALLGLPTPRYRHHPLLTDAAGRRLAKRDGAPTIRSMRQRGMNPSEIIAIAEACPYPDPSPTLTLPRSRGREGGKRGEGVEGGSLAPLAGRGLG